MPNRSDKSIINDIMSGFAFESDITRFSWVNALACAKAANLAYEKQATIHQRVTQDWGMTQYEFIHSGGTQAFIASNESMIIVAFRGTEATKLQDWATDLNFNLVPGQFGGKIHEGFHSALSSVWRRTELMITKFRENKDKSLWFTGHSLGAALATLAVARLRADDHPVDGLYTFGQPRTGDRGFAREFNNDFKPYTFRFVNNSDTITRIPPRSLSYSHVGTFRYFDCDGRFHEDMGRWNRFLDRVKGGIEEFLDWGIDGLQDHSMDDYLTCIHRAYKKDN